ncbi:MAG: hypothetical protein DWI57_04515 [Chloroflexi bacterium]|nr:MAG: hypothetical protein DWI57_04515 [Chloroflexota bacterium]
MSTEYHDAVARQHYSVSLRKAQLIDLMGLITGADTDLVSFDEVASRLKARQEISHRTEDVPLDKIVGSVGRYKDFTREFLPRSNVNIFRWAKIDAAINSLEGVPPIELYKLGDVYFVRDGNHRVSVARANEIDHIEAFVTELKTPIPLTLSDFERDLWIIKIEYVEFMAETHLDLLRPGADISMTVPGRYEILLHQIEVHRYLRNLDLEREGREERLGQTESVVSWYDTVYLPVVEAMRHHRLLEHFPGRTEADLYLWIIKHREALASRYDLAPLDPDTAVTTFAETHSDRPLERTIQGLRQGLHWTLGDERPLGMSEEVFEDARARHDAGERTLREAEEEAAQELAETKVPVEPDVLYDFLD